MLIFVLIQVVKENTMVVEVRLCSQAGRDMRLLIKQRVFAWGDIYTIDIVDERDELEGIMLVIAIDAANCEKND